MRYFHIYKYAESIKTMFNLPLRCIDDKIHEFFSPCITDQLPVPFGDLPATTECSGKLNKGHHSPGLIDNHLNRPK